MNQSLFRSIIESAKLDDRIEIRNIDFQFNEKTKEVSANINISLDVSALGDLRDRSGTRASVSFCFFDEDWFDDSYLVHVGDFGTFAYAVYRESYGPFNASSEQLELIKAMESSICNALFNLKNEFGSHIFETDRSFARIDLHAETLSEIADCTIKSEVSEIIRSVKSPDDSYLVRFNLDIEDFVAYDDETGEEIAVISSNDCALYIEVSNKMLEDRSVYVYENFTGNAEFELAELEIDGSIDYNEAFKLVTDTVNSWLVDAEFVFKRVE